jgi:hypothetical protein
MVEIWHSQFNPSRFLSRTNIDHLIEINEVFNENLIEGLGRSCIICSGQEGPGLLLNDKSYLCKSCFEEVSRIQFPEKYESTKRQYLKDVSARQAAFRSLIEKCKFRKLSILMAVIGLGSLALLLVNIIFAVIPILCYFLYFIASDKHKKKLRQWENIYPPPLKPELRHFHDPGAELSLRDKKILKVFNNWPGYPPFWNYLREFIIKRDGNRCQVSGCPSRTQLHIHHKISVSRGGEHIPSNLITLCEFHHALEPTEGHERVWGRIKTIYFTLVRAHKRRNRASSGYHQVKAHVRRLKLVEKSELDKIVDYYGLNCPSCNSSRILVNIANNNQRVITKCLKCEKMLEASRKLTEETGPRLAEALIITRNKGQWKPRWEMLETRSHSVFRSLTKVKKNAKKRKKSKRTKKSISPSCPKCGHQMRLIKPKPGQHWKAFWGCTMYRQTGCKGSRKA